MEKMKIFSKKDVLQIYNSDCLDVFPTLDSESIDFLICDPPYECSKTTITRNSLKDLCSNFGKWDKFFTDWVEPSYRVLKPNSGMVVFVPATRFETLVDVCSSVGFEYVQPWFWHRTNPVPTFRRGLQWSVEHMIYFVKGIHKLNIENHGKCHNLFNYPTPSGKIRFHPTQKPIGLLKDIVCYVSDVGDLILDCFSGSGTTGLAALSMGRRYIGIEREKEYFDKSVKLFKHRLKNDLFTGD